MKKLQDLTDYELKEYYQQYKKCYSKSSRVEIVKKFGIDTKFLYHVVRLINECEQILVENDLDLQKNNEQLKAVRRGEMSLDQVKSWFNSKERTLEVLYSESKLQHSPDEGAIKQLLLNCLEEHYGSLSDAVVNPDQAVTALREIKSVLEKNSKLL